MCTGRTLLVGWPPEILLSLELGVTLAFFVDVLGFEPDLDASAVPSSSESETAFRLEELARLGGMSRNFKGLELYKFLKPCGPNKRTLASIGVRMLPLTRSRDLSLNSILLSHVQVRVLLVSRYKDFHFRWELSINV